MCTRSDRILQHGRKDIVKSIGVSISFASRPHVKYDVQRSSKDRYRFKLQANSTNSRSAVGEYWCPTLQCLSSCILPVGTGRHYYTVLQSLLMCAESSIHQPECIVKSKFSTAATSAGATNCINLKVSLKFTCYQAYLLEKQWLPNLLSIVCLGPWFS